MPLNYKAIREENEREYGVGVGRWGQSLLANRYDDRTHFLYELLQNAEDAITRRSRNSDRRSVQFHLGPQLLEIRHFGKPFDEADVRGICGIGKSTKSADLTAIGRFGIGFKSVYAYTDRPEVHSGADHFAIESFVWPVEIPPADQLLGQDETLIILPLKEPSDSAEIREALHNLGARTLLFLREIEEIEWKTEGGPSGLYLRSQPEYLDEGVRRVTLIGEVSDGAVFEEKWLLFSAPVSNDEGNQVGYVEVGFLMGNDGRARQEVITRVGTSPLVVFFPTVFETHLGFLVQGPYRTTPSRDTIPPRNSWNQSCVEKTKTVLNNALHWLRDNGLLDINVLRCLPLDRSKFAPGTMFAPVFDSIKGLLAAEPYIPSHGGGHAAARGSAIARTQELRELFTPEQLSNLLKTPEPRAWVTGEISDDRTPEIYRYLIQELGVEELRPESVITKLTAEFLEAQSDPWIAQLYTFLAGQRALLFRAKSLPLVRLSNGRHVQPFANGREQAFLPSTFETGFPTVRAAVCAREEALEFLRALGLTEPDPVDDVIWNVLPKYRKTPVEAVSDLQYEADIQRVLAAYRTDSDKRRKELVDELARTPYVHAVDAGSRHSAMVKPTEVYLATDRLQGLFEGVSGVYLVDRKFSCLQGDEARALLEASNALRYLRPVPTNSIDWQKMAKLREQAGHAETSGQKDRVVDWSLHGLAPMLKVFAVLGVGQRRDRARLLWEELAHLEERRGKGVFTGDYSWSHYGQYSAPFDAAFVQFLNEKEWIPDESGDLRAPSHVLFESLHWKENPFLQSKIHFKAPIIDQLAAEVGIEAGALDLLRKLGVTTEAELRTKLGLDQPDTTEEQVSSEVDSTEQSPNESPAGEDAGPRHDTADEEPKVTGSGDQPRQGTPSGDPTGQPTGGNNHGQHASDVGGGRSTAGSNSGKAKSAGGTDAKPGAGGHDHDSTAKPAGDNGAPPFISYVGTSHESSDDGHDDSAAEHRKALEEAGIRYVLNTERDLVPTLYGNPGFDLYERNDADEEIRWVEVKAISGAWKGREVVLTHTEYTCAQQHGRDYWLYVVENADKPNLRRLFRIQDPAGNARNFKFDHGWAQIARPD